MFERPDGHHFATCPPIRKKEDQEILWMGLTAGIVEVVATDTCTFTSKQKAMWNGDFTKIPFGMPGIETMLPLMHHFGVGQGRFDIRHMVSVLSENPARLFGLWPEKGVIQVGSDADLVVFDPGLKVKLTPKNLATNCDYSPYEGTVVKGWPTHTFVRGEAVVSNRKFVGKRGQGRYLARKPPFAMSAL
jgi:dihydropyrimidinase